MGLTVIQALPALAAGGVERGTVELARELIRRGHRAIVVSQGGRLVPRLQAAGAEHVLLDIGRKSPLTLRHAAALRRLIEDCGAHVLHARSRLPAWISYLALSRLQREKRPRFVTTVHGPYSVNRYSAIMVRGERVIAISEFIRDYILQNYRDVEPGRIALIPRGVSAEEFPHGFRPDADWLARWRAQYPQLAGAALVTLPARVTAWKGHDDFIEIMECMKERGAAVHGLAVGGVEPRRDAYLGRLRRRISDRGLQGRVSFAGHRDDVREIMAISGVVLSLARVPEAFGRTTLEALSLGVPVVAYDHGGAAEVLRRVFPGGLVPVGDVQAAAERILGVLTSRPAIPATHPFPLQRMLDRTVALYEDLVACQSS